jgi:hypothetical protein
VIARRGPHRDTLLQQFLDKHAIPSARVEGILRERLQGRSPSRQQFLRWRLGRAEIRRKRHGAHPLGRAPGVEQSQRPH